MRPLKKLLKAKKGIVGIEAAIVLIAFVVIAAALSYVVINMGFFATQKTKETIGSGMDEATSALQLDGSVIAKTGTGANVTYLLVPVKLSVGKSQVDLGNNTVVTSVYLPTATLLNVYNGTSTATDWTNLMNDVGEDEAKFAIFNGDGDTVLESTEKAFLAIHLSNGNALLEYDTIKVEVKTGRGAALTVVRNAPGGMTADEFVDLG
ncbi:MAG: flagellin [Candidatus Bathyarchaeota archaeon]|nr:flagellin [Candidatus Bathyarchaeota archaeon]